MAARVVQTRQKREVAEDTRVRTAVVRRDPHDPGFVFLATVVDVSEKARPLGCGRHFKPPRATAQRMDALDGLG